MMRAEPSGSRKRAREKELTQSECERLDDERVLKAEKAVKQARALVERADKAEEEAARKSTAININRQEKPGYLVHHSVCKMLRLSMQHWGAAREFRLEAEIEELRAEVRRQDALLDRAHNDMASSLERERRLEAHCEKLIASGKECSKKKKRLVAINKAHLNASE